jgi:hypothetical protein
LDRGRPRFRQDFSCPVLLRYVLEGALVFAYGTITLFGRLFQYRSANLHAPLYVRPTTPLCTHNGLGCSHFARRYFGNLIDALIGPKASVRIFIDLFSSRYLDGSVPWVFLHTAMYLPYSDSHSRLTGYPIRLSAVHRMFAPLRSFSQLTTAFIV